MGHLREETREELIVMLQQKAAELGKTPTIEEVEKDYNFPSYGIFIKRFGSWKAAIEAAGLTSRHPGGVRKYTDQELIAALQQAAKTLHRSPKRSEMSDLYKDGPSAMPYITRFGSWNEALRIAGLTPGPRGGRRALREQDMIKALQIKAEELGKAPSKMDVDKDYRLPRSSAYTYHFGSWKEVLAKAGIPANQ